MEVAIHYENSGPDVFTPSVCPACHRNDAVTGSAGRAWPTVIGDRSFVQPAYFVMECRHCGLLYKSATLSQKALADYYSLVDYTKWQTDELFPTELLVERILQDAPAGARVFDFGCSTGRLLSKFVTRHQTFGFEVNESAAQEAAQKGIRMLSADEFAALPAESFDFVLLIDVFEHMASPTDLLRQLTRLLRPGGRLVLVTGYGDAFMCRFNPAQFWYFRLVEHIVMLTQKHLGWLETELGLTLENQQRASHYQRSAQAAMRQWGRQIAYWTANSDKTQWLSPLLRWSHWFQRAKKWDCAPQLDVTRDHVVAVFKRPHP